MVEMRNLFGTIARSTSAPAGYDQIDDTSEGRLKVHAEEAFKAGIKFKARFIGSLEIPKAKKISVRRKIFSQMPLRNIFLATFES